MTKKKLSHGDWDGTKPWKQDHEFQHKEQCHVGYKVDDGVGGFLQARQRTERVDFLVRSICFLHDKENYCPK
jgi:hypothetical protein